MRTAGLWQERKKIQLGRCDVAVGVDDSWEMRLPVWNQ